MKNIILIAIAVFAFGTIQAVNVDIPVLMEKDSKYDTVEIITSANCHMCEERIEHDMSFEKGVKSVDLDLDANVLTIVYKRGKTTEKDLKVALTKIGYDADEMVADQKAHDRLPACCQKGTDPH
jgi:copper chaperone CopZ